MNQGRHVAVVAGVATMASSTALWGTFDTANWLFYLAAAIAAVVAGLIGARALRVPVWAQPCVGALALLVFVTVVFGSGAFLVVVPTLETFQSLRALVDAGFADILEQAVPAAVSQGLLLLTVLGVGALAVVVDLVAVGLRRAAIAGLPLLGMYAAPVAINRESVPWLAFALGAAGYLWLLGTDHAERVGRWGRPFRTELAATRRADVNGPLAATGRRVGLVGIAVAVLIPALIPLSSEGWLGLIGSANIGPGGGRTVTTINPVTELRGQLSRPDPQEMLRLRTDDDAPFYLRLTTLDQFTGGGWTLRGLSAKPSDRVSRGIPAPDFGPSMSTKSQRSEIEIRGLSESRYLPIFANPTAVDVDGDWRWDKGSQSVFSTVATTEDRRYTMESQRVLYDPEQLDAAPAMSPGDPLTRRYTGLNGRAEPYAQRIVGDLTAGKTSQFAKVVAVNEYFGPQNGFSYSLETAAGTAESALVAFLKGKRGYCEQYASAMAYLVRAAGIPARVAIGFTPGLRRDDYWSVSTSDAHAWVEVYFSGIGWVPFDPTPASGTGGRTGDLSWVRTPGVDAAPGGPDQNPLESQAPGTQPTAPNAGPNRDLGDFEGTPGSDPPKTVPERIGAAAVATGLWFLRILPLILLALTPAFVRVLLRRRRLKVLRASRDPVRAAHTAWDELEDTLVDLGAAPEDSETPRARARRLAGDGLDATGREAVALLARAEEQARYAPHARPLPGLDEAVRGVRAALLADVGRPKRLRVALAPISVLDRANLVMQTWGERFSAVTTRMRHAVTRTLAPTRRG